MVQEGVALGEEEVESFYAFGFAQYRVGDVEKAAEVFQVLCASRPLEIRFWFGLAASLQEGKNYEKALCSWAMAALLEPTNPYPHFHAAECSLSLNNVKDAALALKETERRVPLNHPLQERIPLLKEAWNL